MDLCQIVRNVVLLLIAMVGSSYDRKQFIRCRLLLHLIFKPGVYHIFICFVYDIDILKSAVVCGLYHIKIGGRAVRRLDLPESVRLIASDHDKLLPCPCHRHVEYPHLLRDALPSVILPDQQLLKRYPADTPVKIGKISPKTVINVPDEFAALILCIPAFFNTGNETYGKFQSFARMHCHKPYDIIGFPRSLRLPVIY